MAVRTEEFQLDSVGTEITEESGEIVFNDAVSGHKHLSDITGELDKVKINALDSTSGFLEDKLSSDFIIDSNGTMSVNPLVISGGGKAAWDSIDTAEFLGVKLLNEDFVFDTNTSQVKFRPYTGSQYFVVDKMRSDVYTEDGSEAKPFKTIAAALLAKGLGKVTIKVKSGLYVENLDFTHDNSILFDLDNSCIQGSFTWRTNTVNSYKAHCMVRGSSLRSANTAAYDTVGIEGNVSVIQNVALSRYVGFHLINAGIKGNIDFTQLGTNQPILTHLFMLNSAITGIISALDSKTSVNLYAYNCNSSSGGGVGTVTGRVNLNTLNNVKFTGLYTTSGQTPATAGDWHNVQFKSGANDFTNYAGVITADAVSYGSFMDCFAVGLRGTATFNLVDKAKGIDTEDSTYTGLLMGMGNVESALNKIDKRFGSGTPLLGQIGISDSNGVYQPGTITTSDELFKIDSNDTTGGYFSGKIVNGLNINFTEVTDSNTGAKTITMSSDAVAAVASTSKFYVDGSIGVDSTATGDLNKPFKTIQACLNAIGQPTSRTDAMRHIEIHVSDKLSAIPGYSPQTFNGCYEENLIVPSRMITMFMNGCKIGSAGVTTGVGNILKEYSSSRRFGATSSELRPCLTIIGGTSGRYTHSRLRNGAHIGSTGGYCRTAVLKRFVDSVQGDGNNKVTVHLTAGQHTYPITVSNYPTEPYIRILIQGTTNYNYTYDITQKIDDNTFVATRVSGTNTNTGIESGNFFETDSAGSGQLTHDAHFVNTYIQSNYSCDDGINNSGEPSVGGEILYLENCRVFGSIDGTAIQGYYWNNNELAGTINVSTLTTQMYNVYSSAISTATFTNSGTDMHFMNCQFSAAVPITVRNTGQTVVMDSVTYTDFLAKGCTWVTNTPTVTFLDGLIGFYAVSTAAELDAALTYARAVGAGTIVIKNDITYSPTTNKDITGITLVGGSTGIAMSKLTFGNANYLYGNYYEVSQLGIDPYNASSSPFRCTASTGFYRFNKLQHRGTPSESFFDAGGNTCYIWDEECVSGYIANSANVTLYAYNGTIVTLRSGGIVYQDSSAVVTGAITTTYQDIASQVATTGFTKLLTGLTSVQASLNKVDQLFSATLPTIGQIGVADSNGTYIPTTYSAGSDELVKIDSTGTSKYLLPNMNSSQFYKDTSDTVSLYDSGYASVNHSHSTFALTDYDTTYTSPITGDIGTYDSTSGKWGFKPVTSFNDHLAFFDSTSTDAKTIKEMLNTDSFETDTTATDKFTLTAKMKQKVVTVGDANSDYTSFNDALNYVMLNGGKGIIIVTSDIEITSAGIYNFNGLELIGAGKYTVNLNSAGFVIRGSVYSRNLKFTVADVAYHHFQTPNDGDALIFEDCESPKMWLADDSNDNKICTIILRNTQTAYAEMANGATVSLFDNSTFAVNSPYLMGNLIHDASSRYTGTAIPITTTLVDSASYVSATGFSGLFQSMTTVRDCLDKVDGMFGSTAPTLGQIPVADSNGTYNPSTFSTSQKIVTVGTTGADYTSLVDAVDFLTSLGKGGTIIIITDVNMSDLPNDVDASGITFLGAGNSANGRTTITYTGGTNNYFYGSFTFKNINFVDNSYWILRAGDSYEVKVLENCTNARLYLAQELGTRIPGTVILRNCTGVTTDVAQEYTIYAFDYTTFTALDDIGYVYLDASSSMLGGLTPIYSLTRVDTSDKMSYTAVDSNWTDPNPTTVAEALDRMAALLVTLNSGNPIP